MLPPPPRSTLFPYTTLFRSLGLAGVERASLARHRRLQAEQRAAGARDVRIERDRKSTRLNSSHLGISYAVFCLKKKRKRKRRARRPRHLSRAETGRCVEHNR